MTNHNDQHADTTTAGKEPTRTTSNARDDDAARSARQEFIRQMVATWAVPGPDLAARLGRMLGFDTDSATTDSTTGDSSTGEAASK